MARPYAFTRTVILNSVTVMLCNKETAEVTNYTFVLSGHLPTDASLKRIAQKRVPADEVVVDIAGVQTTKQLLGITEETFLANAVVIDPRTHRPVEQTPAEV